MIVGISSPLSSDPLSCGLSRTVRYLSLNQEGQPSGNRKAHLLGSAQYLGMVR